MIDSKFILTIFGLTIAVLLISKMSPPVSENWINVPRTAIASRYTVDSNGNETSIRTDYKSLNQFSDFITTPSFQANLSPRFFNGQYGANIQYNPPELKNLASPLQPLDAMSCSKMATKETSGISIPSLRRFMPTRTSNTPILSPLII